MNKKGFTLIELLAVIVILAIIAVIAVPRILNIVEDSKKNAAKSSALGYIDAIEKQIAINDIKENNDIPKGGAEPVEVSVAELNQNKKVKVSGEAPKSGKVWIDKSGKVTGYDFRINGYRIKSTNGNINNPSVNKDDGKIHVTYNKNGGEGTMAETINSISSNTFTPPLGMKFKEWNSDPNGNGITYTDASQLDDNITLYAIWEDRKPEKVAAQQGETHKGIVYMDPTNLKRECNASNSVSTTGTKTGCMKFYIYDDSGDEYKMILDHNTTPYIAYETSGVYKEYEKASIKAQVDSDTAGWVGYSRLITANELATITNSSSFNGTETSYFYFDGTGIKHTRVAYTKGASAYAWLYDYTSGCMDYGCNIADSNAKAYWTSTQVSDRPNTMWHVYFSGSLNNSYSVSGSNQNGIRPVIEIPKSSING